MCVHSGSRAVGHSQLASRLRCFRPGFPCNLIRVDTRVGPAAPIGACPGPCLAWTLKAPHALCTLTSAALKHALKEIPILFVGYLLSLEITFVIYFSYSGPSREQSSFLPLDSTWRGILDSQGLPASSIGVWEHVGVFHWLCLRPR